MASRDENILKIKSLKQQLSHSEKCQRDCKQLIEARTAVEYEIEKIKEEIEKLELKNISSDSPKNLLAERLAKQQDIDHRLDLLEEWTEEKAVQIREELIALILEVYPGQKEHLNSLFRNFHQTRNLQHVIIDTQQHIEQILDSLRQALKIRAKVKSKGVLCYIIGPNPNILIGKRLENIFETAEKMLETFPDLSQNPVATQKLKTQYTALEALLRKLSVHCQSRWGFKTIDTTFTEAKEKLELFFEAHHSELSAIHAKLKEAEAKIEKWIEKHS